MAKYVKKSTLNISGVYNIEDGKITIQIEDVDEPIDLATASESFNGQEVTVSIAQKTELA